MTLDKYDALPFGTLLWRSFGRSAGALVTKAQPSHDFGRSAGALVTKAQPSHDTTRSPCSPWVTVIFAAGRSQVAVDELRLPTANELLTLT